MENPVFTQTDYNVLKNLVTTNHNPATRNLGKQISRAEVLTDADVPEDAVRLNSHVEIYDTHFNKSQQIRIVMPDSVDLKNRQISVFAPLSVALLGRKKGDEVELLTEGVARTIKVIDVRNQAQ